MSGSASTSVGIPFIKGSPGAYLREIDESGQPVTPPAASAMLTFGCQQGTLKPSVQASINTFTNEYGNANYAWSYGIACGIGFLNYNSLAGSTATTTSLYCLRVVNTDAYYSSMSFALMTSADITDDPIAEGTIIPFVYQSPFGTQGGYDTVGNKVLYAIHFSRPFAAGDTIAYSIVYNNSQIVVNSVNFSGSNGLTQELLVNAITTSLEAIPPPVTDQSMGGASIFTGAAGNIILVEQPEGLPISLTVTVTTTGSTIYFDVVQVPVIFDIYAENPGAWSANYGVSISNISTGQNQTSQLIFSGPLVTGNDIEISLLVNNSVVNIVASFITNNDTTLTDLAAAIQTALGGDSVVTALLPTNTDGTLGRIINITAPNPGVAVVQYNSSTIGGGATQPTVTFTETYAGTSNSNTFQVNVWKRGYLASAQETFVVALTNQLDSLGNQQYMTTVINDNNGGSDFIRALPNATYVAQGFLMQASYQSYFPAIYWLTGGLDGSIPTDGQIIDAMQIFTDTETYTFDYIINGGYTSINVQDAINQLAISRNGTAILDAPSSSQATQSLVSYRTGTLNIDSSHSAMYSPNIQVFDTNLNQSVFIPPSGDVAARYIYTSNFFAPWWSPAGNTRGLLPRATNLAYIYQKTDRDALDAVQINCLKWQRNGTGILIWGDNTLQVTPSLLSAVNVRNLMNYIENTIVATVELNTFDQNSPQLAFLLQTNINKILSNVQNNQGLSAFQVLANSTNNPGQYADAGQFNISVYVTPIRAVRTFLIDSIITPSDISFSELILNGIF